jgi:hypothetical protein
MDRDYDPCADGIDGCEQCDHNGYYSSCDYPWKYDLETGESGLDKDDVITS